MILIALGVGYWLNPDLYTDPGDSTPSLVYLLTFVTLAACPVPMIVRYIKAAAVLRGFIRRRQDGLDDGHGDVDDFDCLASTFCNSCVTAEMLRYTRGQPITV